MRSTLITRAVFASAIAAGVLLATAVTPAAAREGSSSRSVGHGIKCRTVVTVAPDGTRTVSQVCYKGV